MDETNNQNLGFEEFFNERVRERGLNLKKLSEFSGIALKHLENLSRGDFGKLPSSPYFRGYLARLGEILSFDHELWWKKFKEGNFIEDAGGKITASAKKSGKGVYAKLFFAAFLAAAFSALAFSQYRRIAGKPSITVTQPAQTPATATAGEFTLSGFVKNATGLSVNGEPVPIGNDGAWEKKITLQAGVNSLEIKAGKFLGGETSVVEQIFYEPAIPASSSAK